MEADITICMQSDTQKSTKRHAQRGQTTTTHGWICDRQAHACHFLMTSKHEHEWISDRLS